MFFLKRPFKKLSQLNHSSDPNNTSTDSAPSKTEGIHSTATTGSSSNSTPPTGNVTNRNAANRRGASGSSPPNSRRQSGEIINEERKRQSMERERREAEMKRHESMARAEDEKFTEGGPSELTKLYRHYSMNMSKRWRHENRILFKDIDYKGK
jgi:hypothetical protein